MTEDVVRFFNRKIGKDLTPAFNQYLRRPELPALELRFDAADATVSYRWKAAEPGRLDFYERARSRHPVRGPSLAPAIALGPFAPAIALGPFAGSTNRLPGCGSA